MLYWDGFNGSTSTAYPTWVTIQPLNPFLIPNMRHFVSGKWLLTFSIAIKTTAGNSASVRVFNSTTSTVLAQWTELSSDANWRQYYGVWFGNINVPTTILFQICRRLGAGTVDAYYPRIVATEYTRGV